MSHVGINKKAMAIVFLVAALAALGLLVTKPSVSSAATSSPCIIESQPPYLHSDKLNQKWVYAHARAECRGVSSAAMHSEIDREYNGKWYQMSVGSKQMWPTSIEETSEYYYLCWVTHTSAVFRQYTWVNYTYENGVHGSVARESRPVTLTSC